MKSLALALCAIMITKGVVAQEPHDIRKELSKIEAIEPLVKAGATVELLNPDPKAATAKVEVQVSPKPAILLLPTSSAGGFSWRLPEALLKQPNAAIFIAPRRLSLVASDKPGNGSGYTVIAVRDPIALKKVELSYCPPGGGKPEQTVKVTFKVTQ